MTLLSAIGEAEPDPKPVVKAPTLDLFGWIDALWTKKRPEGSPPTYMMHRFLASDKDLAAAARELQLLGESKLIFATWQALLPKAKGAPRFQYVAVKKPPAEELLVARVREALCVSRGVAEQMVNLATFAGQKAALYAEFGIDEMAF